MKMNLSYFNIVSFLICCNCFLSTSAQRFDSIDPIPQDIVYWRASAISTPNAKVIYGRPSALGAIVFGNLVAYNEIWRTGANEATEIKFYEPVIFGGKRIPRGSYTLLSIPAKEGWQIILNSQIDVLGAHFYNPSRDVARVHVKPRQGERIDTFSIAFKRLNALNSHMVLAWDITRVIIPIKIDHNRHRNSFTTVK